MNETTPRVFVPQRQPTLDLTSARKFGEIRTFFDTVDYNDASQLYVQKVKDLMLNEFLPGDYLLLVGDMVLCSVFFKVMADLADGEVRCLKWDRYKKEYYPIILTGLKMTEKELT